MRYFLAALLPTLAVVLLAAPVVEAQIMEPIDAPSGSLATATFSDAERARLLARSGDELQSEPIPQEPYLSLELELVTDQRQHIDIGGITALQWISAIVMIAGGVTAAIGGLIALVIVASSGDAAGVLGALGGGGLGGVALGGTVLALCELDGNLHRRRELDGRIRVLRSAQREVRAQRQVRAQGYVSDRGAFVALTASF
jgi:hypothetical protein